MNALVGVDAPHLTRVVEAHGLDGMLGDVHRSPARAIQLVLVGQNLELSARRIAVVARYPHVDHVLLLDLFVVVVVVVVRLGIVVVLVTTVVAVRQKVLFQLVVQIVFFFDRHTYFQYCDFASQRVMICIP